MEVKEMRKALIDACDQMCVGCPCEGVVYCDFTDADDEQIYIWHGKMFPEPVIKDSGEKQRVFSTGAVRDADDGKGRMDLLPWAAIIEVSKHCQRGAEHYGEHNVDKGIPTSALLDSGMRHIAKHMAGWTDEDHLVAAAWNLLWAVEMTLKHPELVDTPWMPEMDGDT